jgi:DNA-binding transcriptional ArsR family regulator
MLKTSGTAERLNDQILVSFPYFDKNGNMEEQEAVKSLAALAQAARLQAFRALVVAGPAGLTPSALAEQLGLPASTLSFHLKELLNAGLISQQRDSRNLIYRAAYERMNELLAYLTEHCCAGAACGVPATGAGCEVSASPTGCGC